MAPLATIISLSVLLASVSSTLAGPACARRHYQKANCMDLCKSKWGWTGAMMNNNPWGSVVQKKDTGAQWDSVIASACGFEPSASGSGVIPSASIAPPTGNAISAPKVDDRTASAAASIASSKPLPASIANFFSASTVQPTATAAAVTSSKALPTGIPSVRVGAVISTTATASPTPLAPVVTTTRKTTVAAVTTSTKPTVPTTTQAAATTSVSSSGSGGSSSGTSAADISAYLAGHNTIRAQHGATALTWNNNLASKAQEWANKCVFKHSGGTLGAFGENLAAGTGAYSIASAVKAWTDEVSEYNASNPVPSHFTQVVWKGTSEVGCAVASCSGIFDAKFGLAKFYVCEYSKQGNVIGQFAQNVQA